MITAKVQGSMIFISSIASLVGITNGNANYSASKGGINTLTRAPWRWSGQPWESESMQLHRLIF